MRTRERAPVCTYIPSVRFALPATLFANVYVCVCVFFFNEALSASKTIVQSYGMVGRGWRDIGLA